MKFYGKEKNRNTITFAAFCLGMVALIAGIRQIINGGNPVTLIFSILILALALYRTRTEVTEEGFDVIMGLLIFRKHTLWKWEDINFVFADFNKAKPDVVLVVRKGNATKKAVLDPDSVQQIFDWAAEKNDSTRFQYNGDREFNVKDRHRMSEDEYAQVRRDMGAKPRNFHEMADIARQTKRELQLRKPDPKKLKVKRNEKTLKGKR